MRVPIGVIELLENQLTMLAWSVKRDEIEGSINSVQLEVVGPKK